jgi:coenzyme F420-reducing hydrogenase alpha subunit
MEAGAVEAMRYKKPINVDYLARVEGETAIRVELGPASSIELKIFEPPRFFEGFMVGRKYDEVGDIVSRICGICPVSHMTTAIQAVERAMGIKVSQQTVILRKIFCISQIVASHLVHLYMLAMPDYYGYTGIVDMQPHFKKEITRLMLMKQVVNELTALIGGRALHPVTQIPGGFTAVPKEDALGAILNKLKQIKPQAKEVVKDVSRFNVPDLHSDSEYVALASDNEYAISEGRIVSTEGLDASVDDYHQFFEESEVAYAFAKKSTIKGRSSFMVGALARLNNKFDKLQDQTKSLAKEIGFKVPNNNPFYNNLAQSLEVVDGIQRCTKLIESNSFRDEDIHVRINAGEGGCVTEAPRGLLYHWYRINRKGVVEKANIVTPTSHNFLNIEKDLKQLVDENKNRKRDQLRLMCEQLVRAYDPCFSCSVH